MLKYKIALINVFWTENDLNTRYFNSIEEQNDYFSLKISGQTSPLINFNMGNNIETSVIYRDVSVRSVEELVASNYAVVEQYDDTTNEIINRRYYFAYAEQDSGRQMRVILKLDDIQTNYFKYKDKIAPCFIRKANINRFIKNNSNYKFDNTLNSKLYETEGLVNFPKIPVTRYRLKLKTTVNDDVNQWLYENVAAWCYIFVDPNKSYKAYSLTDVTKQFAVAGSVFTYNIHGKDGSITSGVTGVICYPIMKPQDVQGNINNIYFTDTNNTFNFSVGVKGFEEFKKLNQDTSYVYSIKLSNKPPFNNLYARNISIVNNNLILRADYPPVENIVQFANLRALRYGNTKGAGLLIGINDERPFIETYPITTGVNNEFTLEEIVNVPLNYNLNPKLNSNLFKELVISTNNGDSYIYDLQKIGENQVSFLYTETIQPEVSKVYVRLNAPIGLYQKPSNNNYDGLVTSIDNSIAYVNTQYANFIANNKNFWLQSNVKVLGDIGTGVIAGMVGSGDPLVGGITGVASGIKSTINRNLTISNLKSAPSMLKNANGNALFNLQVNDFGIYVELRTAITNELIIANDYLNDTGFTVNIMDKIINYDNIRTYFNYIEADVEVISAPISNLEKERLKTRLKAVRFWNTDNINYDNENYERSLNNG